MLRNIKSEDREEDTPDNEDLWKIITLYKHLKKGGMYNPLAKLFFF